VGFAGKVVAPPVVVPPKPSVPKPPVGAITSQSGWYLKSHSIASDLVTLNALKQSSDGGFKSDITATATNAELIEFLLNDNNTDALHYAVTGLLGAGIVWTLDAANQRISYTDT